MSGPAVYLLGQAQVNWGVVSKWLKGLGVETPRYALERQGSEGEVLCELAGRRCYKSFEPGLNPNVTKVRESSREYHGNILASGHGSVLEHFWTTWAFEGVSRIFTHELIRHRVGTAFSQESLRYVRASDYQVWEPPNMPEEWGPNFTAAELGTKNQVRECEGVIDEQEAFKTKKELTSALRRILPQGMGTGIVFSANMRALRYIVGERTSEAAEIEMRVVFDQVARICKAEWPLIFQDMEPKETGPDLPWAWVFQYPKV